MVSKTNRKRKTEISSELDEIESVRLQSILDNLYDKSKKARNEGIRPKHKNLLEIVKDKQNIIEAMNKISKNKGKNTAGIDGVIWDDWSNIALDKRIDMVLEGLNNYQPQPVKRVYIEKPGSNKKRPLGIPTIIDRIIQECVRKVIEPICEAQFYAHSYGFRPDRNAHNALTRINHLLHQSNYKVAIEGDIKGYFDNINHRKLLRRMWHIGIRDRRLLMLVTKMLKAGILENEFYTDSVTGTPQGGVISPLLANIYLDRLDEFIYKQWEFKKTKYEFSNHMSKSVALRSAYVRGSLKLMPMYIVRYADDWIIFTENVNQAKKIKELVTKFLDKELNLTLSKEKTHITDTRKKKIQFLGFEIGLNKSPKQKTGWKVVSRPNRERLKQKVKVLRDKIDKLKRCKDIRTFFNQFMRINSTTIGLINYYTYSSLVNIEMKNYAWNLCQKVFKILRKRFSSKNKKKNKPVTIEADKCHNNRAILQGYTWQIPYFEYEGLNIGFVRLDMCRFLIPQAKVQEETKYSEEGRNLIIQRKIKEPLQRRLGYSINQANWVLGVGKKKNPRYNITYIFNRDEELLKCKGRCRVCNVPLIKGHYHIHHKNPKLPISKVNNVENLCAVCTQCHKGIHFNITQHLTKPIQFKRIEKLRNLLSNNTLIINNYL